MEVKNILSPYENSNQRIVNIVLASISILNYLLIYLSFKKNYGIVYSYSVNVYFHWRFSILMLDIENVRVQYDESEWLIKVMGMTSILFYCVGVNFFVYANIKYNRIMMPLSLCFVLICCSIGVSYVVKTLNLIVIINFSIFVCTVLSSSLWP